MPCAQQKMLSLSTQIVLGMFIGLCLNAAIASVWLCYVQPHYSITFFVFTSVYSIFRINKFAREFPILKLFKSLDYYFAKTLNAYQSTMKITHPQLLMRIREFFQAVVNDYSDLMNDIRTWGKRTPLSAVALNRFVEETQQSKPEEAQTVGFVEEAQQSKLEEAQQSEPEEAQQSKPEETQQSEAEEAQINYI